MNSRGFVLNGSAIIDMQNSAQTIRFHDHKRRNSDLEKL
jgi:hypothetical protein